jgi:hypothetical protein
VTVRQISHQFRHHLEANEKAVKRILVQLVRTGEQIVKQSVLALDVADEQSLGELVLILEVIEEPALGDVDAAISSSIDVAAKPSTAASATSRMRSLVSLPLRGVSCMSLVLLRTPETVPRVHLKASQTANATRPPMRTR